jgi:hypothetical protein
MNTKDKKALAQTKICVFCMTELAESEYVCYSCNDYKGVITAVEFEETYHEMWIR